MMRPTQDKPDLGPATKRLLDGGTPHKRLRADPFPTERLAERRFKSRVLPLKRRLADPHVARQLRPLRQHEGPAFKKSIDCCGGPKVQ